ncbi:hypothetical protein RRG08_025692 [Elysia crispata]|uniref:Uncharacterized protein n=1 Tax=Elysia crispata TaxID=231223 RepID=A0AAE1AYK4_9GAST|nr:hypothetical protein RRG08_025692 [Elysia crispata]
MVGGWVPSHQTSWLDLAATGVTLGERYGRWLGALTPDQLARSSSYRGYVRRALWSTSWLDLGATGVTLGERYGRWVGALTPDQLARSSSYRGYVRRALWSVCGCPHIRPAG